MPRLLIIEDHLKDGRLAEHAAQKAGFESVHWASSFRIAMECLAKVPFPECPLPDAILLDLDL